MIDKLELKKYFNSFKSLPVGYKYLYLIFFLTFTLLAVIRAWGKGLDADFHVFWLAGRNFFAGNEMYFLQDQLRQLLYPPFAAFLFGILAIFPFNVAAVIFAVLSMVLWAACFILSKHIVEHFTKIKISPLIVTLAIIFSINFYLSNLSLLQVNLVVFFLTLLFIYFYLREKFLLAAVFISAAVCFKVTPIIFLSWIFFRGNFKTLLYSALFMVFFTLLPFLLRGMDAGIYDMEQFIETITREIPQNGLTSEDFTNNRSLRGMMTNYMIQISFLGDAVKSQIISLSSVILGILYIIWLVILRFRKVSTNVFELAGTFLIILLTSAVTRTAHMVTLAFPLLLFFSIAFSSSNKRHRIYVILVCVMFLFASGNLWDHFLLERVHVYGLSMLIGFIASVKLSLSGIKLQSESGNA